MMAAPESANNDPYATIQPLYDIEHAEYEEDIPFDLQTVESVGDPVLELGCGTGRVLLPVAEAGFRITGVDLSKVMLDVARDAVAEAELGHLVTLVQANMADLSPIASGTIGTVLITLNGLMHADTQAAQRAILRESRRVLDPRGQLVIDLLNPAPSRLQGFDRQIIHEGTWTLDDRSVVDKFSTRRVIASEQRIETDLWYDLIAPDGALRRVRTSFVMRYLTRGELELMLELAGFGDVQIYGSYDLDPYEDDSDRLLVTAEPR